MGRRNIQLYNNGGRFGDYMRYISQNFSFCPSKLVLSVLQTGWTEVVGAKRSLVALKAKAQTVWSLKKLKPLEKFSA